MHNPQFANAREKRQQEMSSRIIRRRRSATV